MKNKLIFAVLLLMAAVTEAASPTHLKISDQLSAHLFESNRLPLISLGIIFPYGSSNDPIARSGMMALIARSLDTESPELVSELENLGAKKKIFLDDDQMVISATGFAIDHEKLVSILSKLIFDFNPKKENLAKLIERQKNDWMRVSQRPTLFSEWLFERLLYRLTPYRFGPMRLPSLSLIHGEDVIKFWKEQVLKSSVELVAVGSIDIDEIQSDANKYLNKFTSKKISMEENNSLDSAFSVESTYQLVNDPGITDAIVRMGWGLKKGFHQKRVEIELLNVILAGFSDGEITKRVRDELGLTYHVASHLELKKSAGAFIVENRVPVTNVSKFIDEVNAIVSNRIGSKDLGQLEEKLAKAKTFLKTALPLTFESLNDRALRWISARLMGYPENYFDELDKAIDKTKALDVSSAAARYLDREPVVVVQGLSDEIKKYLSKSQAKKFHRLKPEKVMKY